MALTYVKPSGLDSTGNYTVNNLTVSANLTTANASLGNLNLSNITLSGNASFNNMTVTGNIIPGTSNTYSLGTASYVWKDVFIGPGSLYVDGSKVVQSVSNTIVFSADTNQNLRVSTSGTGDIEFLPSGSGSIAVKGPLQIQAGKSIVSSDGNPIQFANPIGVDAIGSHTANTDITLTANGTGHIKVDDDLIVTGNLTIQGTSGNLSVDTLSVQDNIIDISAETTGTPSNNAGLRVVRGDQAATQVRWLESGTSGKWQITNDGSTYLDIVGKDSAGNISTSGNFVGNGQYLTGIVATTAGTVTTNAQPNITSVGTLSSLTVSGVVTATVGGIKVGNIIDSTSTNTLAISSTTSSFIGNLQVGTGGSGWVSASNFSGSGNTLTNLNASNIASGTIPSGILGNSTVYVGTTGIALNRASAGQSLTGVSIDGSAATVTTNAQPNITSVGTLSSVSVTANVSAGNVLTDNLLYANGVAWAFGGSYGNTQVAAYLPTYTGNISAGNVLITSNVYANAINTTSGTNANLTIDPDGSGWAVFSSPTPVLIGNNISITGSISTTTRIGEVQTSPTISAGSLTLDLSTSTVFEVSLNAAITSITISNPFASGVTSSFVLVFTADGTARSVTWPSSIKWSAGNVAPTLTSTLNKKDVLVFMTDDGGTSYYGFIAGQNI